MCRGGNAVATGVGAGAGAGGGVAVGAVAVSAAGGGDAAGQMAQPIPASAKSAAPTAGSQRGVFGSGRFWGCACAGSDMKARRIDYEMPEPVKQGASRQERAILV